MPSGAPNFTGKPFSPRWLTAALAAGLALVTVLTFLGLNRCEFVNLDDIDYVVNNPHVNRGLSWSVVAWAFTHSYSCNWHPLTWLSHALDCQLYGLNPAGHHITNLILHTLATMVLFLALRRMTGAVWRSAVVAALFAVHPLHVESLAWVSERKDVLSGVFFMLTLWAYARYAEARQPGTEIGSQRPEVKARKLRNSGQFTGGGGQQPADRQSTFSRSRAPALWYLLALAAFALGLMSKPMLVTLPFVLLLLDYWPLRRFDFLQQESGIKPLLVEKLPFFSLTAASCVLTLLTQAASQVTIAAVPMNERLANAALSYVAYLRQIFWPAGLAAYYPYPKAVSMGDTGFAIMLLLGVTAFALVLRKSWPFGLTGWLWYLGMLVPVIGIVQVGAQARADRYTYLPATGIFLAVTWAAVALFAERYRYRLVIAAGGVLGALAWMAHGQMQYWRNSTSLFTHASDVVPNNYFAMTQVAMTELKSGQVDSAMARLTRALELEPAYPVANHQMGVALLKLGKAAEAVPYLERAEAQPELRASSHLVLALVYMQAGDLAKARDNLERASSEKPGEPDIEVVRANLLIREKKPADAEKVYREIRARHPEHQQAQIDFATFLLNQNRPAEAEPVFATAISLAPTNVTLRTGYASALSLQGKLDQALQQLEAARKLAPADSMVQFQSGEILSQAGRTRDAISCYEKAIELNSAFAGAMNNLAWILATDTDDQMRNGRRAVELAEKACELTKWDMPLLIGTLAAAYAEAGRFNDAIKTAERAREKARQTQQDEIVKRNEELIELYRSGKPYRDTGASPSSTEK